MEFFFIVMSSAGVGLWLYNLFMRTNGDSRTSTIAASILAILLAFIEFMVLRAIN